MSETGLATDSKIIKPSEEVATELKALTVATASALVIKDDDGLAEVEAIWNRSKRVIANIEKEYADEKKKRHMAHKAICDEESAMISTPKRIVDACVKIMKPYLAMREQARIVEQRRLEDEARRQAEDRRRQEAEQARREADERARIEREAAEERGRIEREAADRLAKQIEEEAIARARELEASGKNDEAEAVLDDAQNRMTNVIEEAREVVEQVTAQAEDVASRAEAEGHQIAQEIASTPVQHIRVDAPAGPTMATAGTSKTYKCDREKAVAAAKKLTMLKYIVSEAERGNFTPLSWVDHNFKQIDISARQSQEMFPSEDISGLDVGLDVGIRSKPGAK